MTVTNFLNKVYYSIQNLNFIQKSWISSVPVYHKEIISFFIEGPYIYQGGIFVASVITGYQLGNTTKNVYVNSALDFVAKATVVNNFVIGCGIQSPWPSLIGNGFMLGQCLRALRESPESLQVQNKAVDEILEIKKRSVSFAHLMNSLDAVIAGQDQAKRQIAQAISVYLKRQEEGSITNNRGCKILLTGPSGSGKTTMVKEIAKATGLPMVTIDTSRLVNEGVWGTSISTYFQNLIEKADNKVDLAKKGIVFLDEFDKAFQGASIANTNVQMQLLKILEGSDVQFGGPASNSFINTSNMIFFISGTFTNVQKGEKGIEGVSSERLIDFGLSPELVGRITNIVQLEPPREEDIYNVLQLENGDISLRAWENEFASAGAQLVIDPEVIDIIVKQTVLRKTGIRGLDFFLRQLLNSKLCEVLNEKKEEVGVKRTIYIGKEEWLATDCAKALEKRKQFPSIDKIKKVLDYHVFGQEEAKKVIAEAISYHCLRLELEIPLPKGNVLMIGPSGSGKTYMMEVISKELGLPLAILDASKLTRTGTAGGNKPEDAIVELLEQTNGDVRLAGQGIIFLDEFDKQLEDIRNNSSNTGESVLNQLLRMLQSDKVAVTYKGKTIFIDTKNILFVMGGAFSKFPQLYRTKKVDEDTLLKCGIRSEFLGRIGYITKFSAPTAKEMREYLLSTKDNSPLDYWRKAFEKKGKELTLTNVEIDQLIKNAQSKTTGLRALQNELRSLLIPKLV